jgi:hypothetical protein
VPLVAPTAFSTRAIKGREYVIVRVVEGPRPCSLSRVQLGAICEQVEPPLVEAEPQRELRCHIPLDELRRLQVGEPEKVESV